MPRTTKVIVVFRRRYQEGHPHQSREFIDMSATGADMEFDSAVNGQGAEPRSPQGPVDPIAMLRTFRDQITQDLQQFGDTLPESLRNVIREEIQGSKNNDGELVSKLIHPRVVGADVGQMANKKLMISIEGAPSSPGLRRPYS
jgi:hypothetical protein